MPSPEPSNSHAIFPIESLYFPTCQVRVDRFYQRCPPLELRPPKPVATPDEDVAEGLEVPGERKDLEVHLSILTGNVLVCTTTCLPLRQFRQDSVYLQSCKANGQAARHRGIQVVANPEVAAGSAIEHKISAYICMFDHYVIQNHVRLCPFATCQVRYRCSDCFQEHIFCVCFGHA